jgi:multidrug resistance efflux pump
MSQSRAEPALPSPARPPARGGLSRAARVLVAAALLAAAGYGLVRQHTMLASEHAVVSAHTFALRSPIGGEITELPLRAGQQVAPDAPLARIANPLLDRGRLVEARTERVQLEHEIAGLQGQLAALDAIAAALGARATQHRAEAGRSLAAEIDENARLLAAAEARARRAAQEAARAIELARGGFAAAATRERAEAERDAAMQDAAAAAARLAQLRTQDKALGRGFFLTAGYGGVGYLEQRLDEVALRRAELLRQDAILQGRLARAELRLAEEEARHAQESQATLPAKAGWTVLRVLTAPGQRIRAEEPIADLVDCHAAFVLATVPQSDVPRIAPGRPARVRLDGDREARPATVVGLLPEGMAHEGGRLAALPSGPRGASKLVQLSIAPPGPDETCPIGRTGRVLFDPAPGAAAALRDP